jgi:hypothetical protein
VKEEALDRTLWRTRCLRGCVLEITTFVHFCASNLRMFIGTFHRLTASNSCLSLSGHCNAYGDSSRVWTVWGSNRHRPSLRGIKRTGHEVNHSPPSSAGVMNEWSCASASRICLRGLDKEDFNF